MTVVERCLNGVERICRGLTVALILTTMVVVFCDVMLRHFLNRPLPWAYDLVGMYLLAGTYFLALSDSYAARAHVGVDIFVRRLGESSRRILEMLASAVGITLFGLIGYAAWLRTVVSFLNHDTVSGLIAWPTWISSAIVLVGSALLVLRLLFRLGAHAGSLVLGRAIVDVLQIDGVRMGE